MIKIEIADQRVQKALEALARAGNNLRPALQEIGDYLVSATKRRFSTSTAPDGSRWAQNSEVTILRYLDSYRRKDGSSTSFRKKAKGEKGRGLTALGAKRLGRKEPLIGQTGSLSSQIFPQLQGNDTLLVGSSMRYAAAQQFGMDRGYAGTDKRGRPLPWGDIPARPYLGVSDQDSAMMLDIVEEYLLG